MRQYAEKDEKKISKLICKSISIFNACEFKKKFKKILFIDKKVLIIKFRFK